MAGPRDDPEDSQDALPDAHFPRIPCSQRELWNPVLIKGNMKSERNFWRKLDFLGKVTERTACPLLPSPYMDMVPGEGILGNPEGNKLEGKTQDVRGKR